MKPADMRTLAAYCSAEGASCKEPSDVDLVVKRVRQRLGKKLERKGIALQWQDAPEHCNLWLCFTSVDRGNQFLRYLIPLTFIGAASVSVRVILSSGGSEPDEFSHKGTAGLGLLAGGFAAGMLRVCADRVAANVARTVRKWVARHEQAALRGRAA